MNSHKIFIAPRSGEQSSNNFKKTIEGGYRKIDLEKYLSPEDKKELEAEDTLMVWGNKPSLQSIWAKMEKDDWVLFYQQGNISFAGRLLYKTHNKELADNLWGPQKSENGELISWEYVFFLKDLVKVDIPYKVMADLAGYKGNIVQGFLPYSEEGVKNIIDKYGSLENFFFKKTDEKIENIILPMKQASKQFENILLAIKTKPLILLAGLSGTGKSRLVRTLAFNSCNKDSLRNDLNKPGNFEIIPVKPNWHDSSELMGYVSRINKEKYITTSFLKFIAKAWRNIEVPFFLCLDEMNLAPVEQYLAEYLSIIETRQVRGNEIVSDYLISKASFENQDLYNQILVELNLDNNIKFSEGISIPNNLIVIGTVNMDETTHSFSRKVLDRAMTFEMNEVDLNKGLDITNNDWAYPNTYINPDELIGKHTSGSEVVNLFNDSKKVIEYLQKINIELEKTPFKIAYRVRDEFLIYCYYASLDQTDENWLNNALDEMTCMKILARIEGDETKTGEALKNLQQNLTTMLPKSNLKLKEMETRLLHSGYTSFWS